MVTYPSLINELEDAISSGRVEKRLEQTLWRVTELFAHGAERYSAEHVALFDDVIGRLAQEIEVKARAKLASRLASFSNAPRKVVSRLASDDEIEVAGPLLTHSPVLDESDLLKTAQTKSQDHLLAISQRPALSEAITDVLVDRGNRRVVRTVAQNTGARFSNAGFRMMVKRATGDELLAEHVGVRADIPRTHFLKLVEQASDSVKTKLLAANPTAQAEVAQVMTEVVENIRADARQGARDYKAAIAHINAQWRSKRLDEAAIYEFAQARKLEETIAGLALIARLPIEAVETVIGDDRPDTVLILGKACDFSWSTVKMLLLMRSQGGVSVQDLERALQGFERLQITTAKRVLEFYRTRGGAKAIA